MRVNQSKKRGRYADSRPTIGFIIADIIEPWQILQWRGVVDAADEQDINLICFPGGEWRNPNGYVYQANVLYDLIDPERLDGLIIWTGGFDLYVSRQEMEEFCRRYRPLPIVSASRRLDGIPSVIMEDYKSMVNAMAHLIEKHGYRRIAFIRGPEGHKGFEERYRAYRDTLEKHGIPLNPEHVYSTPGNEIATRGEIANWLLDPGRADIEAIVGHNDTVALLALEILRDAKIRVPEDVAVVGYDDVERASFVTPSLTSVRPPFYEMGRRLVEVLLALMDGQKVPHQMATSGKLVVRESCGCEFNALRWTMAKEAKHVPRYKTLNDAFSAHKARILSAMNERQTPGDRELFSQRVERLLNCLMKDLKELSAKKRPKETSCLFITALGDVLQQMTEAGEDVWAWHEVLLELRLHILRCLAGRKTDRERAENLFRQACVLIGERSRRAQMQQMLRERLQADVLREISEMLITTHDMEKLMDIVALELPRLDITSCYLSLYTNPRLTTKKAIIRLAYDANGRIEPKAEERIFPSSKLVPDEMLSRQRRYSMVVKTLHFREDRFGFVLFEIGPRDGRIYCSLEKQLGSALKGALLVQERKQVEEALFFQAQELLRYNAELEQFTYTASHDLQEPLRKVMIFSDELQSKYGDLLDERGKNYLIRMHRAATRMKDLINALLTYARVTTKSMPFISVDLGQLVQDAVSELNLLIESEGGRVEIGEFPTIEADPIQLRQLFKNIIDNAFKFRRQDRPLAIKIHSQLLNGREETLEKGSDEKELCEIRIEDNGIGFDEKYLRRIFQVFQQLHSRDKYEGLGLGLAICRKIVERHNGQITAESRSGEGATFIVTLPVKQS